MKFTIRHKLFLIIFVVLMTTTVFAVSHFFEMLEHNKEDIKTRNLQTSKDLVKGLDDLIDKSFGILKVLSRHPAVMARDSKGCDRLFAEILPSLPLHLNIIVADMNGNNFGSGVYSTDVRSLNYNDMKWFVRAKEGKPIVGDLHISKLFKTPTVMIAAPIFDKRGKQTGVIGSPLNILSLRNDFIKSTKLPAKSTILVLDSKSNVVLCTLHEERTGKKAEDLHLLQKEFGKTDGSMEDLGLDGIKRLYSFSTTSNPLWKVIVGVPVKEAYMPAYHMAQKYLVMLFSGAIIAILLSTILSKRITANVSALINGMREVEKGNLSFELKLSGHDELQDVAESFNKMAKERRLAEHKVRESESFLSSVLEGIGEGVIVIGRDFRIISANSGYCDQVKTPCSEIIGRYCFEVSHHISVPCYENSHGCDCTVKKCFETGEHHRAIHTHYDKKGNVKYIETNAYPLRNESGEITSAIETLVDVTDMVLLEKRLEDIKERYRKLYDDAPDMMQSVDKNGHIIICNQTEAVALGYSIDELIGKSLFDIIAPEHRDFCIQKFELLKKTGSFEGETTLVAKDGKYISVLITARAIFDSEGNFLMTDSVLHDITEKKKLEAQLLHAQKMEAVGQLAGGVAHDFNNILTAIMGYGNILQMKMGKGSPLNNYVDQIISSTERAANLTQSLLAFSRKQIINLRSANLNEIVRTVQKLLLHVIGEDIEQISMLSNEALFVEVDIGQIEQVLMNLATNARDAMPEGGTLTITTERFEIGNEFIETHGYGSPGPYAVLSVSDTGNGISGEILNKIFEPFFTTKEVGKGTGLGLSIVYGIIKQHNGYITVSSELNKGTTFYIYLPLRDAGIARSDEQAIETEIPRGSETILLAEDDAVVRSSIKNILEEFGYSILEAVDGKEAVNKFIANRDSINLFISDVIMPRMNGKEAHDEIRRIRPDIRVIYTSGYTADLINKKGVLNEGIIYIQKPVSPYELLRKVRETLDNKIENSL